MDLKLIELVTLVHNITYTFGLKLNFWFFLLIKSNVMLFTAILCENQSTNRRNHHQVDFLIFQRAIPQFIFMFLSHKNRFFHKMQKPFFTFKCHANQFGILNLLTRKWFCIAPGRGISIFVTKRFGIWMYPQIIVTAILFCLHFAWI